MANLPSTTDRPPLALVDASLPTQLVRQDLERLATEVQTALQHADQVLDAQRQRGEWDGQRDALHLVARIEGLAHQVEHAADALHRLERRKVSLLPVFRPSSLESLTLSTSAIAN